MEIVPNRIRGGLEAFSAVWYVVHLLQLRTSRVVSEA